MKDPENLNSRYIFRNVWNAKKSIFNMTFYLFNHDYYSDLEDESLEETEEYDLEREKETYYKLCYHNLSELLKRIESPLTQYTSIRTHKAIPLIITVMFFSIMVLVKDEHVTPKELEEIVRCPIDSECINKFKNGEFFKGMIESLEILFGLSEFSYKYDRYNYIIGFGDIISREIEKNFSYVKNFKQMKEHLK